MKFETTAEVVFLPERDTSHSLRKAAQTVLQLLMEADIEGIIGASRHERSPERQTWRNGYRDRRFKTQLGRLELKVPRLREGSYYPRFLGSPELTEEALLTVIQEAWTGGASTDCVNNMVQTIGMSGITQSQISGLCQSINERVTGWTPRKTAGNSG